MSHEHFTRGEREAIQPAVDRVRERAREDAKNGSFDLQGAREECLPMAMEALARYREQRAASGSQFSMHIPGDEDWHKRIFRKERQN
jgi:hypothetical protein